MFYIAFLSVAHLHVVWMRYKWLLVTMFCQINGSKLIEVKRFEQPKPLTIQYAILFYNFYIQEEDEISVNSDQSPAGPSKATEVADQPILKPPLTKPGPKKGNLRKW